MTSLLQFTHRGRGSIKMSSTAGPELVDKWLTRPRQNQAVSFYKANVLVKFKFAKMKIKYGF